MHINFYQNRLYLTDLQQRISWHDFKAVIEASAVLRALQLPQLWEAASLEGAASYRAYFLKIKL